MKKTLLSTAVFIIMLAGAVWGAQLVIDTVGTYDTPQKMMQAADDNFDELYGKWTSLGATHDTSGELDALYEAELDNSAGLASALSDETGTGVAVFSTSPGFTTAANPVSSDGAALGTIALEWSDIYLADGAVIYGQADQSNTITSGAGGWTFNIFPITPSAAPDADYEVANKKYVDDNSGGSGDVSKVGTPAQYEWGEWTGDGTLKGTAVTASKVVCTDANGSPVACTNLTDLAFSGYQTVLTNEAGLYSALSDVSQFYEAGDTLQTNSGTSLPGTCTVGEMFLDTDADTNGSLYTCIASDTWKEVDDDGGAGGGGDLLADGTVPLTANWDVGSYYIQGTQFRSDIAIGTPPFVVTSTDVVTNLNADTVDGSSASDFESATSNDFDPDRLSGDTVDDNLIDQDIIAGLSSAGSATPGLTAYDSGAPGADKEIGKLYWNDDGVGGDGSEYGDFNLQTMYNGSEVDLFAFDASGNLITISRPITFTSTLTGNITGNASGTAATVTGAAQAAITSLGTLTTLTVDDITINGDTITGVAVGGLPDNIVDNGMMADNAIDSAEIASNAVDAGHISTWQAYDNIPVAWMKDGSSAPDALDDGTTRSPYAYRTFASDADEDLNFVWFVPSDLSGSAVQFRVKYLVTNATGPSSEGVAFGLSGVSLGDNDATNGAKGTVVVVTDPTITAAQHDVLVTGWSGDVTITNLAAGEVAELALIRDVSDAADDYGQVVGVIGIEIRYTKNPA